MGRCDDRHIGHTRKPLFLESPHTPCQIDGRGGAFSALRATVTACLPFVTLRDGEMRAYGGKRPAIVERPHDGDIPSFDIPKQERKVDIAAMQVVQMDQVGGIGVRPFQEAKGSEEGKTTLEHGKARKHAVKTAVPPRADLDSILHGLLTFHAAPMSRDARNVMLYTQIVKALDDFSRTALTVYSINL